MLKFFDELRPYVELVNGVASLLALVTWLVAVPFLILAWRQAKQIKISVFGIEATFEQGLRAAAALGAAEIKHPAEPGTDKTEASPSTVAQSVQTAIRSLRERGLVKRKVLWVDDRPENNRFERSALEAVGAEITTVNDTDSALHHIARQQYDLVISDMARPSGPLAGYDLLRQLRGRGIQTPFVIYSSFGSRDDERTAIEQGAQGATNHPGRLFELAIGQLAI